MAQIRLRDLGIVIGELPTGSANGITDVCGVRVGHATLISGSGRLHPGHGPVRTGVTVILPHEGNLFQHKVRAAVHTINGYGKVFGFEQVLELGVLETPVALTNTLNVGLVADALVQYAIRQNPEIGITTGSVNVVVGETNDGFLNDLQGRHVRAEHVWSAIENSQDVAVLNGAVGAGTGTCCMGWKGGIGSASRVLPVESGGFTLGALVQTNFGKAGDLKIADLHVSRYLSPWEYSNITPPDGGSVMIILATDAPLSFQQLKRLCVRAGVGLARVGSHLAHGSGDFVIAFSTAVQIPHQPVMVVESQPVLVDEARVLNLLFRAVVESVEEAVLNSLCYAETMVGRDGNTAYALPTDRVKEIWEQKSG